jgi:hypothetical protein
VIPMEKLSERLSACDSYRRVAYTEPNSEFGQFPAGGAQ